MSAMRKPDVERLGTIAEELVCAGDEGRLDRIALAIAAREYGTVDVAATEDTLEELAQRVRDRLTGDEGPSGIVASLSQTICREAGFRVDVNDYYEPRNSYLTDVLARRLGIPVTLSVVYHEIARRVGFPMVGIGVPARFMLGYRDSGGLSLVDVAAGGAIITEATARELAERNSGRRIAWTEHSFRAVSIAEWARRILNNLFRVFKEREEYDRALRVAEDMEIVLATPDVVRDRGLILARLRRWREAEAALARYLDIAMSAPDREAISQHLAAARARIAAQ
ncbi:MAG: tetratricopeptide repeat protein [Chloroflexota bacterium]|nr:MAG: tetratricopeptide repeat protein [Chloroflexota bacterium]